MGPPQGRFEGGDPLVGTKAVAALLPVQPSVLASGGILVAPAPDEGLAEAVFAADLGEPFLAAGELANDLQLELAIEVPFHHRSAPWRWCWGWFPSGIQPRASPYRST